MSLNYTHTLIPASAEFSPPRERVQTFLAAMVARGVVGGEPAFVLRAPSGRTREVRNPFSGAIEVYPISDHTELADLTRVAAAIEKLKDYRVEVLGVGRPRNPPVPLEFDGPYHIGVGCIVSSELCSMSDLHKESGGTQKACFFGRPCGEFLKTGYFSNPSTLEIVEVPGAGCARFWVEFSLGKLLFPRFDSGGLECLDPAIVREAERLFGVRFLQGCHWG
jgi:hypothetical protein